MSQQTPIEEIRDMYEIIDTHPRISVTALAEKLGWSTDRTKWIVGTAFERGDVKEEGMMLVECLAAEKYRKNYGAIPRGYMAY